MHELLALAVEAHEGLARWKRHETLSATIATGDHHHGGEASA
jgi:hypothetical protein